jgi:DNA polymerase III subunit alpha
VSESPSAPAPGFIHLRLHTEYSLVDGLVDVKALIKRTGALGMPAVAVTDHNNLFAIVKFYKSAQSAGIKPIAGADVFITHPDEPQNPFPMTLFVQNQQGYRTLSRLISKAYRENQHQGQPQIRAEWLEEENEGLIALSGPRHGEVARPVLSGNIDEAKRIASHWQSIFGNRFYLEIQRTRRPFEEAWIAGAVEISADLGIPLVATNDVRFLESSEFEAHEARVCIHQGRVLEDPRRPKDYTDEQYLKSEAEMAALFADLPEALANTVGIAERCSLKLTLGQNFLPQFPVPEGMTIGEYFAKVSREGLDERLAKKAPVGSGTLEENTRIYQERLELEVGVINQMDFPGYFLIVADFIQWAKTHGIPVGPGRGSGAGSLVAYALKITDLDPIEFELLFERFLNPERVSMPDFDVDFCMERRDEVIDYVAQTYGRDRVSQIITYGSMAAKAVVRDVGRVLGHPYGFVDRIAKLIPFEIGMTLEKALQDSEDLRKTYETDEEVKALIDLAQSLEGLTRNAGKHAGGVVISPSDLTDFCPLYCEAGGENLVTQYDKDDVEAVGLVKFDFLGLRTLTIIDWALETINAERKEAGEDPVDISLIPLDDPKTYELLKSCQTTAVFQLESRGMKDLIKRLRPDCFEDIIALVALFRPGPLQSGMVDDYINVKHGKQKAEFPHPVLEPILKPTNGVIVYQEQVMKIAQDMAAYTLGGADLLRRAMGKKKPEEMAKQREIFVAGATSLDIDEKISGYIFDLMEKFAGYGFNKSHSAAYALVSYQTAWLKAHYPSAFMAAVLSSDMDKTDKVVVFIEECRQMRLEVRPPDINRSRFRFRAEAGNTIQYGLGAIKGVGESAILEILEERDRNGPFKDLRDFCRRIDTRKANRRVLEALIRGGALDSFHPNRAQHLAELTDALKAAEQHGLMAETGQFDLFGLSDIPEPPASQTQGVTVESWSEDERLAQEKLTLGLYLTGHPITRHEAAITPFITDRLGPLVERHDRSGMPEMSQGYGRRQETKVVVAGLIVELRMKQNKNGKRMAFMTLDDRTGRIEVALFSEAYDRFREYVIKDQLVVVEGGLSWDDFAGQLRLSADNLMRIGEARARFAKRLQIRWEEAPSSWIDILKNTLSPHRGGECPVFIERHLKEAKAVIQLGDDWRVQPQESLIGQLEDAFGEGAVRLRFD